MTRELGARLARIGARVWLPTFICFAILAARGGASPWFWTFPLWAPPLFYMTCRIVLPIAVVLFLLSFAAVLAVVGFAWRLFVPR